MHDDLLSIGAFARAGGVPVTALRYYDAAGVLRPAHVDPATGYRWYTSAQVHTAQLVASLRQAGLPVTDLAAVLAAPHEAHDVLARHRRHLEADLDTARAHLDVAEHLLAQAGSCTVATDDLVSAVAAVRNAVSADPDQPGLGGVLLHLDGTTLRLVGCDRFRLAVTTVPVRQASGPPSRVIAPLALLDQLSPDELPDDGTITLSATALEILGVRGEPIDAPYPDYERLLRTGLPGSASIPSDELVENVAGTGDVVAVRLDGGRLEITPPGAPGTLGFSRSFLLDAVRAARSESVELALDERSALSVSPTDRPHDVHVVMPIRLSH